MPRPALSRVQVVPELADDGDRASLAEAVRSSLAYYARLPGDRPVGFGADQVTVAGMRGALEELVGFLATDPSPAALRAEISRRFVAYRSTAPADVLYTGYYVPTLAAREVRDDRFRHPILGRPPDLVTVSLRDFAVDAGSPGQIVGRVDAGRLVPYYTRAQINGGVVAASPILAWVEDPVALFFLQIQGSGTLLMPDGARRTIGFAASNGHPYVSIGKLLIDEGQLTPDTASMDGIRRWCADHPGERDRVLDSNPRYVFFRPLDGPAVGSLGVPLIGGRSIATDPSIYPPGALAFVRLHPGGGAVGTASPERPFARLMLNQDSGAAIQGPARVDLFFGEGTEAEPRAGRMKARGELYFLAPRADGGEAGAKVR